MLKGGNYLLFFLSLWGRWCRCWPPWPETYRNWFSLMFFYLWGNWCWFCPPWCNIPLWLQCKWYLTTSRNYSPHNPPLKHFMADSASPSEYFFLVLLPYFFSTHYLILLVFTCLLLFSFFSSSHFSGYFSTLYPINFLLIELLCFYSIASTYHPYPATQYFLNSSRLK